MHQSIQLSSTVTGGTSPFTYSWSPSVWLNDSALATPICTPMSSKSYQLVVTDSFGCIGVSYANIGYQVINLGNLAYYAAFAGDSILSADSSFALGNVCSRYIDTSHLKIELGYPSWDTTLIRSLKNELISVFNKIDTLHADTISSDLSNDTLTSGIYRITSNAILNGTLTLTGNDSSYFILDIDSNWIISDNSKIIHEGIDDDKVFFFVNGELQMGDSLQLNCIFCSLKKIIVKGFKGVASMLTTAILKGIVGKVNNYTSISYNNCFNWGNNQLISKNLTSPPLTGGPQSSGNWNLIFEDKFDNGFNTSNCSDNSHKWCEWGGWGDAQFHKDAFFNVPGVNNFFISPNPNNTDNKNLTLRVTKLALGNTEDAPPYTYNNHTWFYSMSQIRTKALFYHGYFEIRAKLCNGDGVWPAFWVMDGNCNGTDFYREIDFFDAYLKKWELPGALIYNSCKNLANGWEVCPTDNNGNSIELSNDWHIYAGEWNKNNFKLYIDNKLILTLNNTLINDRRMPLILGNQICDENYKDNTPTGKTGSKLNGNTNNDRDFVIDYVRVWQKSEDMFAWKFIDECDGKEYSPATFPVETGAPSSWKYHIEVADLKSLGYEYHWQSSDPTHLIVNQGSDWNSQCYFYGTATGNYTITLTVNFTDPKTGIKNVYHSTIPITIINNPLPLSQPTIHYDRVGYSCSYHLYFDIVPHATSYLISLDGGETYFESSYTDIGTFDGLEGGNHIHIIVKALYHDVCSASEEDFSITLYPADGCFYRFENNNSFNSKMHIDSIRVYPSPSDGHLIIENSLSSKIVITLKLINGVTVSHLRLNANERTQLNNLPQGLIIMEAKKEENYTLVYRGLIPIIKP